MHMHMHMCMCMMCQAAPFSTYTGPFHAEPIAYTCFLWRVAAGA